ncbi:MULTISPECIES: hypothetical protein [unclassified Cryobacterium]|uniref:hypothetical protein n=1 Tax=unclassified Cryobacterium TaxID=2649013 RepID=UPI0014460074|nr:MULTISPECIES: hypothetical protein [unclassified Cryobacterium]
MAASAVAFWAMSGGVQAEVVAKYPGPATRVVQGSAEVHVVLQVGWFNRQRNFDIVLTGSGGEIVDGRNVQSNTGVLSFTPEVPLSAGTYGVEVHHRESPSSKDNVIDSWPITVEPAPSLSDGSGGSILVVARQGTRDAYLAEILRAEGFTGFDTVTPEELQSDLLASHPVVILGAMSSTGPHLAQVESWVMGGGELITMKPEGGLAELAGLEPTGLALEDGYLEIDTTQALGVGLTAEAMQFHGGALLYTTGSESQTIATLSPDRERSGPHPALTLTEVGNSAGHIAAFSYDLATSVIYTRQGHPDAAGSEHDGSAPIRPNDLFIGTTDEPDYLDQSNIGIPQADEQMRLLSNVLVELHGDTSPLPRFWYLPNGEKTALVMTADDHGTEDGTRQSFERMLSLAEPGCDVERWECPRATSWLHPPTPLAAEDAERYWDLGFDLGAHVSTGCADWTEESLDAAFAASMLQFRSRHPALPDQTGHRLHCVAYSDWLGLPTEERQWGIRLDMNYYNWPPDWIRDRPGYITGSALPMRFSDEDGRMLDVFQQETHLVNETWMGSTAGIDELITAAEDERGYYGLLGTHYDFSDDFDQKLMDVAVRRDIPMISAGQLLDFTEGRQASTFTTVDSTGTGDVAFEVQVDPRVDGLLTGMLPADFGERVLTSLTADGVAVDYDVKRIKGISYAFFQVDDLRYQAGYR